MLIDIPERSKADQDIKLLLNNTVEAFVLIDVNFYIVSFNVRFQQLYLHNFGIKIKKGESIIEYAQPERKEVVKHIFKRVLKGANEEAEINIPSPDGTTQIFTAIYKPARDEQENIIGIFISISDITARKKAEEQLLISEQRFKALIENGTDTVVILTAEGKPLYISPSVERVLGYTSDDAMHLDLFSLTHPDDIEGVAKVWEEMLANPGVSMKGYTFRILHKDGSWRWFEDTVTNMLHDPAINGVVDNF